MAITQPRRSTEWLVGIAVAVVTAYPPLSSILKEGLRGVFSYLAADAFYYLSIATRSAGRSFFTFDGSHPTNGFHPLWGWVLERSHSLVGFDAADLPLFAAATGIVLVALGTALFSVVLLRVTARPWLALIGSVPGIYYLMVPTINAHYFAQWSFVNGMESPLSICFFAVLLAGLFLRGWLDDGSSRRAIVLLSVVLSALTLSRLDDVFIFIPFLVWAVFAAHTRDQAIQRVVTMAAVPTFLVGGYLLYNLAYTESMLPSSGSAKAQPLWALLRNLYASWTTLLPLVDPLGRGARAWSSEAWRILQMLVPAIASTCWLIARPMTFRHDAAGDGPSRRNGLIGMLAIYVMAKFVYNFTMVGLWHQGYWYYPLSIMTFNLIAVTWLASALDQRARSTLDSATQSPPTLLATMQCRWPVVGRLSSTVPLAISALVILVSANAFIDLKKQGRQQARNFEFWLERDAIREQLVQVCPGCGVVAFDDGIVAFSLENTPVLNGLGLVLDREARTEQAEGRLLDVAYARGYRLLASVNYSMPRAAYSSRRQLRESLRANRHLAGQDLEAWEFDEAFRSESTDVSFIRFRPRHRARDLPYASPQGRSRSSTPTGPKAAGAGEPE